jgi:hypothetical protein
MMILEKGSIRDCDLGTYGPKSYPKDRSGKNGVADQREIGQFGLMAI